MEVVVKKMESNEEIEGRGYVHWKAWQEAYTGLVDQQYLDTMSAEQSIERAYQFRDNNFVAKVGNRVVGFAAFGENRSEEEETTGEIYAVYVLKEFYGTGAGKKLMDECLKKLVKYNRVCVWVLEGNKRAIRFYEKNGFQFDGGEQVLNLVTERKVRRMTLDKTKDTAGYCGLACKSCSVYIASLQGGEALEKRAKKAGMTSEEMYCTGCRSEKTSPYCTECKMKKCIREKGLTWCSECQEYPCTLILDFQKSMPHRHEIIQSLDYAKDHTMVEWDKKMEQDFTCGQCGSYNSIYSEECPTCHNKYPNPYAKRYWDELEGHPERKVVNDEE